MACFIATGAAARAQQLTVLSFLRDECSKLRELGAKEDAAHESQHGESKFTITNEQFKQYMQWKQERSIAARKQKQS